jgi:hypothetical protein
MQSFRENILPVVDKVAHPLGLYSMYRLGIAEKIGATSRESDEVVEDIKSVGFEYNGLSAIKKHPARDILDSGSYRLVPDNHPEVRGARITEEFEPNECQYHLHLFEINNLVEYFIHYETRPDIFSPSFSKDRLETHYRPEYGQDYIKGAKPDELNIFS